MLKFPSSHTWKVESDLNPSVSRHMQRTNTYGPKAQRDVALHLTGRSIERMIDVISYIGSKDPVVSAIAEKISNWHGGVRKTMHKESFQNAFSIVCYPTNCCNAVCKWNS